MRECPKCGSTEIHDGYTIAGKGADASNLVFCSYTAKGLFIPKHCKTQSFLCLRCGYIEFYSDNVEEFKKKIEK